MALTRSHPITNSSDGDRPLQEVSNGQQKKRKFEGKHLQSLIVNLSNPLIGIRMDN